MKANALPSKKPKLTNPRPPGLRSISGYSDRVRNMVFNFCSATNKDLAIRYLYPKADVQSSALDHDYLKLPYTEYWVDRVVNVTTKQAADIEAETKQQAGCARWAEERQYRLTASRFGEICKMTQRRNIEKLCNSLFEHSYICTPAITHGKLYESTAIKKFETITNLKVQPAGLFVLPELPYLGASPDGLIDDNVIVEVKCPYSVGMT